jgi:hypothetical protein
MGKLPGLPACGDNGVSLSGMSTDFAVRANALV